MSKEDKGKSEYATFFKAVGFLTVAFFAVKGCHSSFKGYDSNVDGVLPDCESIQENTVSIDKKDYKVLCP